MSEDRLKRYTLIIMIATFGNRMLGFVREMLIGYKFGADSITDAYFLAFSFPDIINNLVIAGFIGAGLLPVLISNQGNLLEKSRVFSRVINSTLLTTILVSGGIYWWSSDIIKLLAPGFTKEQIIIGTKLLRVMSPVVILLGMSSVFRSALQSEEKMLSISVAPMFYNAFFILTVLCGFGIDIRILAFSVIVGAFFQMSSQMSVFNIFKYKARYGFGFNDTEVQRVYKVGIPAIFAMGIVELNNLISKIVLTEIPGAVSALNYAYKILQVPLGVMAAAVSVASFSLIATMVSKEDYYGLSKLLADAIHMTLYMLLPIMVIFLFFSESIVRILFMRGAFGHESLALTSRALIYYSLSIIPLSLIPLINNVYYSLRRGLEIFLFGLISALVNASLAIYLKSIYGLSGVLIAFVASSGLLCALTYYFLTKKVTIDSVFYSSLRELRKAIIGTIIMSIYLVLIRTFSNGDQILITIPAMVSGVFVYLIATLALGHQESRNVYKTVVHKIKRTI